MIDYEELLKVAKSRPHDAHIATEYMIDDMADAIRELIARAEAAEKLLAGIVTAWEVLSGGRDYKPHVVETWLRVHMTPAINNARAALAKKADPE